MKKVKIMLMSAIVVAAVGGALAFNANKGVLLNCGDSPTSCPTPDIRFTTVGADETNFVSYCTPVGTTQCIYAKPE